jgi:23S rRNA pseudouridine955/2504/2580 synthase
MVKPFSLENNLLQVATAYSGQRLDNFLLSRLPLTRGHLYKLIRTGQIRVNGSRQAPSARLQAGDTIRLPPFLCQPTEASSQVLPERAVNALKTAIVFENDAFVVLYKPAGIPTHAGSGLQYGVIDILRQQLPNYPDLSLVHRLDRATSGLLLLAKTPSVLRALIALWPSVQKTYLCLVDDRQNQWQPHAQRTVALPLWRLPSESADKGKQKVLVHPNGKAAQTDFFCLAHARNSSWRLLAARLHSGRMHQIRVHAAASGFPLAGDILYHPHPRSPLAEWSGLLLHAWQLAFVWEGEMKHFIAEPKTWQAGLMRLFPDFSLSKAHLLLAKSYSRPES